MTEQTQLLDKFLPEVISMDMKGSSTLKWGGGGGGGGENESTDFLPPFSQELLSKCKTFKVSYEIHTVQKNKGRIKKCTLEEDYSF